MSTETRPNSEIRADELLDKEALTFSPEARQVLEDNGYAIVSLTGESVSNLIDKGEPIQINGYFRSGEKFVFDEPSVNSEVAIRLDYATKKNNPSRDVVSQQPEVEIRDDIEIVKGSVADYAALMLKLREDTGVYWGVGLTLRSRKPHTTRKFAKKLIAQHDQGVYPQITWRFSKYIGSGATEPYLSIGNSRSTYGTVDTSLVIPKVQETAIEKDEDIDREQYVAMKELEILDEIGLREYQEEQAHELSGQTISIQREGIGTTSDLRARAEHRISEEEKAFSEVIAQMTDYNSWRDELQAIAMEIAAREGRAPEEADFNAAQLRMGDKVPQVEQDRLRADLLAIEGGRSSGFDLSLSFTEVVDEWEDDEHYAEQDIEPYDIEEDEDPLEGDIDRG